MNWGVGVDGRSTSPVIAQRVQYNLDWMWKCPFIHPICVLGKKILQEQSVYFLANVISTWHFGMSTWSEIVCQHGLRCDRFFANNHDGLSEFDDGFWWRFLMMTKIMIFRMTMMTWENKMMATVMILRTMTWGNKMSPARSAWQWVPNLLPF